MDAAKKGVSIEKQKSIYQKLLLVYWKEELNALSHKTGISLESVAEYLGVSYKRDIGFYAKLPHRRRMIIGIGMAYKLTVEEINEWLMKYAKKSRLYAKDVFGDLVWIYLINCNYNDKKTDTNYYKLYDRCSAACAATYQEFFREVPTEDQNTETIAEELRKVGFDKEFKGLRGFVVDHLDAFHTAYTKPRKILEKYASALIATVSKSNGEAETLSSLRGYLDDSMINYLSGSKDTLHAVDLKTGEVTGHYKILPKTRKEHIAICLALGMVRDEINSYLSSMGYIELDSNEAEERALLMMLDMWDDAHPMQKLYKRRYIDLDDSIEISEDDEITGAYEMLQLRQSLKDEYERKNEKFSYISD